jgi:hypothetical protein
MRPGLDEGEDFLTHAEAPPELPGEYPRSAFEEVALRKLRRSKEEWAQWCEDRLDEITAKLSELTQLQMSGAMDEAEFIKQETALREDFGEVADHLERGTKGGRSPHPGTSVRVVTRI